MKNQAECKLVLEDKSFVNDKGETVDYLAATVVVDGESIHVSVKKEDRGLLRVLRRGMPEVK